MASAAGLRIVAKDSSNALPEAAALEHLRHDDRGPREEHRGWCEFHLHRGWQHANIEKKDPARMLHPYLVPWERLKPEVQGYDRRQSEVYVNVVYEAGFALAEN